MDRCPCRVRLLWRRMRLERAERTDGQTTRYLLGEDTRAGSWEDDSPATRKIHPTMGDAVDAAIALALSLEGKDVLVSADMGSATIASAEVVGEADGTVLWTSSPVMLLTDDHGGRTRVKTVHATKEEIPCP